MDEEIRTTLRTLYRRHPGKCKSLEEFSARISLLAQNVCAHGYIDISPDELRFFIVTVMKNSSLTLEDMQSSFRPFNYGVYTQKPNGLNHNNL